MTMLTGKPAQLTAPLHRAAAMTPHAIASIDGERQRSWSERRARVARLAAGLLAQGLAAGERVAILARNGDCFSEALFAVWWAGGVVVPLNTRWSVAETGFALRDAGARLLLLGSDFAADAAAIRAAAPGLAAIIRLGTAPAPGGMACSEALIARHAPCPDRERSGDELAGLFYTGGTTGFPKGVMLSHGALCYNAATFAAELGCDRDTRWLHAAPMFHLADFAGNMATTLVGGCHVHIPAFSPEAVLAAIERHGANTTLLVPTMIAMLLDYPGFRPGRAAALKRLLYGASPMPEGLLRRALAALPQVAFQQGYGQTEMGPGVSMLPPEDHVSDGPGLARLRSAGRPSPGCEVMVIDRDGRPLPPGTIGEIAARSPGMMQGYWNQPELTAATLVDGWVRTGDSGFVDADGYITIVDRLKDMIVTGGENVFSAEVESAISTHPDVAAVAVIGIPDPRWGEVVHAEIIPRPGARPDPAAIAAHCRARIAAYKCPRSIALRSAPFPLSGAGKVLKRELRAPYWQDAARGVN